MKFIKKIASVLTATILFVVSMVSGLSLTVGAKTSGTYETLSYVAYDDYVEITGCEKTATEVTIPSEINGLPVTNISRLAFFECEVISIEIPESVTSIGDYAFISCKSLTSIEIPNSVTSIGGYAFYNTPWLEAKKKENPLFIVNNILIDGNTCSGNVVIPEGVISIGGYAFYNCESLTEVIIPETVTSIGGYAFYNCESLTEVIIPETVTSIGDFAFWRCSSLTSIIIPESVTSIGHEAFSFCKSLTAINVLPDNLNYCSIDGVLYNKDATTLICCPGGTSSIEIPKSVTSIGDGAFYKCESLTEVIIPESVTSIGGDAFRYCSSLTEVIIPDSVTTIESMAFAECGLQSLVIPKGITVIEDGAFSGCSNLTSVTIPESVTSIGDQAFYGCGNLSDIYYYGIGEDWNKIEIGESNSAFTDSKLHFKGDVDGNGKLNLQDAVDISLYNMNMITFTEEQIKIADYTGDGKVGLIDVVGVATAILPSNK